MKGLRDEGIQELRDEGSGQGNGARSDAGAEGLRRAVAAALNARRSGWLSFNKHPDTFLELF